MSEKLKFYKGLEENLVNIIIELGAIYHCTDTGNTYIGVIDPEGEVLEDGTYPLKLDLYSTVSDIYIGDDETEGGFELVNADTLGGFPADEYALKSHVYEKIDEINIDNYATREEVSALTYEDIGAAPAGDYATKDDLNAIDFPIDSVNGKTGVVELVAEDVGAPTIEYAKKVGAPHNLLDNSDFRNPVNQRKEKSYVWTGDGLDRWYTYLVVTVNDGYVRFENTIDESRVLYQRFPLGTIKNGTVYTFAYKRTDGVVKVLTATCGGNSSAYTEDGMRFSLAAGAAGGYDQMANNVLAGSHVDMVWCALYEGEYTAETLPEYQPKGYGTELVECMRYYQIGSDQSLTQLTDKNGALPFSVSFKVPMRIPPTLTLKIWAIPNVSGAAGTEQTNITIGATTVDGAGGYTSRGGLSALQPYRQGISFVASAEL